MAIKNTQIVCNGIIKQYVMKCYFLGTYFSYNAKIGPNNIQCIWSQSWNICYHIPWEFDYWDIQNNCFLDYKTNQYHSNNVMKWCILYFTANGIFQCPWFKISASISLKPSLRRSTLLHAHGCVAKKCNRFVISDQMFSTKCGCSSNNF